MSEENKHTYWISSKDRLPKYNVSVLVYIPEEDNHVTTGMWDISNKWVLLDEYRVPHTEVTYWREIDFNLPEDNSYTPSTKRNSEEETTTYIIRELKKSNYYLKENKESLEAMVESAHADALFLQKQNAKLVESNTELLSALKAVYDRLETIHRSAYCQVEDDGTLEETNKIIEKYQSIEQNKP